MRSNGILLLILVFAFYPGNSFAQSQTPEAAVRYYENGAKKFSKGDFAGALEDYTKAIEISSRLAPAKRVNGADWRIANDFADASTGPNQITVIDPFTARAYANRSKVRFQQRDFDGTIADCEQALRINPGLAVAYLNRGAARREKGDMAGALADFDRSLSIDTSV